MITTLGIIAFVAFTAIIAAIFLPVWLISWVVYLTYYVLRDKLFYALPELNQNDIFYILLSFHCLSMLARGAVGKEDMTIGRFI